MNDAYHWLVSVRKKTTTGSTAKMLYLLYEPGLSHSGNWDLLRVVANTRRRTIEQKKGFRPVSLLLFPEVHFEGGIPGFQIAPAVPHYGFFPPLLSLYNLQPHLFSKKFIPDMPDKSPPPCLLHTLSPPESFRICCGNSLRNPEGVAQYEPITCSFSPHFYSVQFE